MAKRGRNRKRKEDNDDPVVDMTWEPNKFHYVIPVAEDTPITNQKQEGTCQKWACADMMSIVLRIDFPGLVTSPQIIIDAKPLVCDLIPLCVHQDFGLESVNDYPVIRIGRNNWDGSMYQTSQWRRYRLHDLVYCEKPNQMKGRILGMFCDGGYRLPCLGVMRMGRLFDKVLASRHASGELPPFRHPTRARDDRLASKSLGQQHAMLIVGVNTTSDNIDDHYCVVKNTHGETWGDRGRSRVAFEVFEYVMFPVYKGQEERDKEEREKKEKQRKKMEKKEKEKEEGKKVEEKSDGGVKDTMKTVEEEPEGRNDGGDAGGSGSVEKRKNVEEIPDGGDDSGVASGGGSIKKRKKVEGGPEGGNAGGSGSVENRKNVEEIPDGGDDSGGVASGGGSIKKRKKVEGGPEGGDDGGGGSVIKRKNEQVKEKSGVEGNDKGELGAGVGVEVVAWARSSELLGSDFLVPKESDI